MKKIGFLTLLWVFVALSVNAQTKKDGTPDMRYRANKEMYGSSYSSLTYKAPSYESPTFNQPKTERNYENGGQWKLQNGYTKDNGTYVAPHIKTTPDNNIWNNKNYIIK